MRIIVAIDDSPFSKHLVDRLCDRHWSDKVELKLLTVIEPISNCEPQTDSDKNSDWKEEHKNITYERKKHALNKLIEIKDRLTKHIPKIKIISEIREGIPSQEIVVSATEWPANLIIIGSRGKYVCPHNSLGSVSHKVAQESNCPVEVVREKIALHK